MMALVEEYVPVQEKQPHLRWSIVPEAVGRRPVSTNFLHTAALSSYSLTVRDWSLFLS